MRVTIRGRLQDEERGATLVIVALSLIAIFAMVILTVDVGGLLLKRRAMVNASDAAALAAAQSCVRTGAGTPEAVADQFAADNVSGLLASDGGITASVGCPGATGYVTVRYSVPQQLWFAGVLGFGGSGTVTTTATAAWGTLGGGNAVPIVVDSGTLQGPCTIPGSPGDQPHVCNLWYNNGNSTLGNSEWGFLNLDEWNVTNTFNCNSAGGASNRGTYIQNDFPTPLNLNGVPLGSTPTYVCSDSGHATSNWSDLRTRIGDVLLFPVNDCSGQLPSPCPSNPDKYDIIGFVGLYLQDVLRGDDPAAIGTAGASGTCTVGRQTFNTNDTFAILAFGTNNGCTITGTPDPIPASAVHIFANNGRGAEFAQCVDVNTGGCAYLYITSTQTVTWLGPRTTNTQLKFDWATPGQPGKCGIRASDPNALCLVAQWRDFTTGPGPIGSGQNFGAEGIRLCDLNIPGSCPNQ